MPQNAILRASMLRVVCALVASLTLCTQAVAAASLEYVGGSAPGPPDLNAAVAGLDGFVSPGSWGGPAGCPSLGGRVFAAREPANPVPLGTVAAYSGTTAEHVV